MLARARAHRAEKRGYDKTYRLANLERKRAADRAYFKAHPEKWARYGTDPKRRAYMLEYFRRPGVAAHYTEIRRVRKLGAPGSHTNAEWLDKVALLGGCCIYCGRSDLPLCRDHKVPLTRGGTNDIGNVVPACRPCNSRKHNRTASEFLALRVRAA